MMDGSWSSSLSGIDFGCSYGSYLISRKSTKRPKQPAKTTVPTLPPIQHREDPIPPVRSLQALSSSLRELTSTVDNLHTTLTATGVTNSPLQSSLPLILMMGQQLVAHITAAAGSDDGVCNSTHLTEMFIHYINTVAVVLQHVNTTVTGGRREMLMGQQPTKHASTRQRRNISTEKKRKGMHSRYDDTVISLLESQVSSLRQRLNALEKREHQLMRELHEERLRVKQLQSKLGLATGKIQHRMDLADTGGSTQGGRGRLHNKEEIYQLAHFKDENVASKTINKLKEFGIIK